MKQIALKRTIKEKYIDLGGYRTQKFETKTSSLIEDIINKAIASDVPLHNNTELLRQMNINDFLKNIPEELYIAIAEILKFINKVEERAEKELA